MLLTERDVSLLRLLLTFGYLVTSQIRRRIFPADRDGSVTRDRLRKLEGAGLIVRRRAEVANPFVSNTMPVWIITEAGICALSLRADDATILHRKPPCTRSWQNFAHYAAVAELMLTATDAIQRQTQVTLGEQFFEHSLVNAAADDPAQRYKLYTIVSSPEQRRLVAAPDAALELRVGDYRRAYYIELERGTDTPPRVAAKKSPGYAALFATQLWRKRHFPHASDLRVLCCAPSAGWRDALRKAMKDKPGSELWLFAATNELTPDNFLHGDLIYSTTDGPRPLVRPEAPPRQG